MCSQRGFACELHKRLFGKVWKWAGSFRRTEKNIGIDPVQIAIQLRLLRAARVVASERRGKQIFYVAADEHIQCVIEDMVAHVSEPSQFEGDA